MEAEGGEGAGMAVEGGGDGDGFPHLVGRFVVGEVLIDDVVGEQVGFESEDPVLPPCGVGQRLDELAFGGAFGVVFAGEGLDVALVGFHVFGWKDDDLAGESVAEGVEA